jgi:hypothetical protein
MRGPESHLEKGIADLLLVTHLKIDILATEIGFVLYLNNSEY